MAKTSSDVPDKIIGVLESTDEPIWKTKMGNMLGVSEGTIRYHVKKMKRVGVKKMGKNCVLVLK